MMNLVALCLVLTTLVTAGVWSPSPTPEKVDTQEDVIVKAGHRTVVVEFEKDDGNTKVSISPQEAPSHDGVVHKSTEEKGRYDSSLKGKVSDAVENVKEKVKDEKEEIGHHRATPAELICDAFGKCKHKIESAIGKTKLVVSEKAHEAADKVYQVEEEAKETVNDAFAKVKDTVARKTHEVSDMAHEAKERVKEAASYKAHEAKERVKDAAHEVSGKAKETVAEKVHGVKEAVDTTKTLKGHVEGNASEKIEATKRKASEKVKEAEEKIGGISEKVEEGAERVKEKGKKDLKEILLRGEEVLYDIFGYVLSPQIMASGMGILQLLGLATAYGMSIWVTFISSYILAGALPRQQFAILQSKIYPVYFRAMAYSVGTVLLGHLLSQRKKLSSGAVEMLQGFNLLASLFMLLFNLRYLEPRATKVMFERMKLVKEEGRGIETSTAKPAGRVVDSVIEPWTTKASSTTTTTTTRAPSSTPQEKPGDTAAKSEIARLSEALKKLNSYSSFLNVLTLMALTWHLVHLGQRLHTAC